MVDVCDPAVEWYTCGRVDAGHEIHSSSKGPAPRVPDALVRRNTFPDAWVAKLLEIMKVAVALPVTTGVMTIMYDPQVVMAA